MSSVVDLEVREQSSSRADLSESTGGFLQSWDHEFVRGRVDVGVLLRPGKSESPLEVTNVVAPAESLVSLMFYASRCNERT